MKKVSFCILMAIFAVAVISCDKNNKEKEEPIVNSGKLEIGGETLPLDSATFAYFEVSAMGTLKLLNGEKAVNIAFRNVRSTEIPIGTFVVNKEDNSKIMLNGVGMNYGKYIGTCKGDDQITISKSGNCYSITLAGTLPPAYKATYSGTIRKAN